MYGYLLHYAKLDSLGACNLLGLPRLYPSVVGVRYASVPNRTKS
jgi:hypothetical protein